MRWYLTIGLAVLVVTLAFVEKPVMSQGLSEKEIDKIICDGLSDWLRKKERSREVRIALRKPRKQRTRKEQSAVTMVEIVRDQYKKEGCV